MADTGGTVDSAQAQPEDKRKPLLPPLQCPACSAVRYQRRTRNETERRWTDALAPALKLRPYRCQKCRHAGWRLVKLGPSKLALAGLLSLPLLLLMGLVLLLASAFSDPPLEPIAPVTQVMPHVPPAAQAAPAPTPTPKPATAPPAPAKTAASTAIPANQLESASLGKLGARHVLTLQTRAAPSEFKTWILRDDKTRFVIDLPGTWTLKRGIPASLKVNGSAVDHIGLAAHGNHLRVSLRMRRIDLSQVPQVEPIAQGLRVFLD